MVYPTGGVGVDVRSAYGFYDGNDGPNGTMQVILGSVNSNSAITNALWYWEPRQW